MAILYGLIAALGWGAGDFVISGVTRRLGPVQTMFYIQLAGIVTIGLVLLARGDIPANNPQAWGLAVLINIFNLAGTLLLYRALSIGTIAIVSPISASFAVITALLAIMSGEHLGGVTMAGTALVIGGVIVVSRAPGASAGTALRGVPEAIGTALCFGIFFWAIDGITPILGIAWPVMIGRVMGVIAALLLLLGRGNRPVILPGQLWPAILTATTLDTLAFLSFNTGIATAFVSVVTALASIFSAVTVLLAWLILRERLALSQWTGVAAVLIGVLLVSV